MNQSSKGGRKVCSHFVKKIGLPVDNIDSFDRIFATSSQSFPNIQTQWA